MDEGTLNDLLECSVCLERLDTSSKVLPCQHTFCKMCLQEIVDSHKELRCPECRILVPCKVDELPPNVLLMRILEGMKNATPKLKQSSRPIQQVASLIPQTAAVYQELASVEHRHKSNKLSLHQNTSHHVHQPYAKALYDFSSTEAGDLAFKRGDTIILKKRIDSCWYEGECGGKRGVFPLSYVQIITPVPSNIPQCKALYDFKMTNDDEEGCLTFNRCDIISVIRRVDENWAEGKLDGRIGIFPLAFVELNSLARSLMKLSTNAQPGPSKVAPPTPTTEDSAPLIPTDHTRNVSNIPLLNTPKRSNAKPAVPLPTSDSSSTVSSGASSTTTTPNTSASNTSSSSSTAPSSPASPPPKTTPSRTFQKLETSLVSTPIRRSISPSGRAEAHSSSIQQNKEKRHSFTLTTPNAATHFPNKHRHSAEISGEEANRNKAQSSSHSDRHRKQEIGLPAAYVALYPYKPQKPDELELRKGALYTVMERCQDGWFKGTSNRTQKCGVFPGNYVMPASAVGAKAQSSSGDSKSSAVSYSTRKSGSRSSHNLPPELPPRSTSPNAISSSWHGQQDNAAVPLGRSSSAIMSSVSLTPAKSVDKKERKEKCTVSLMKRLTSIKRSKSPPVSSSAYSMDNPVFDETNVSSTSHPVHVRSGSCPSQLLQEQSAEHHHRLLFQSTSQRLKHKERPSVLPQSPRLGDSQKVSSSTSAPGFNHHRKSHSLDAGNKASKASNTQTVRERFRCIAPYPPNSEYELELQVNDIIYVHKKREDGWYKGTQQRTGRTGLFPASFVDSF